MPPQAPWSATAHAFAQHQFSHVANFWKQGRQASFRLEALPGGRAELNLTFQLPAASEVVPPPSHVPTVPAPQRPIIPLFPKACFPQGNPPDPKPKTASPKASSKQRKSYRRSVLHRAALAAPSLPPPSIGTLRQAAQAAVKRHQADPVLSRPAVNRPTAKKRPNSPTPLSPQNLSPLAQRIRSDFQIGDCEVESPEKEFLRSQPSPSPETQPSPVSPCVRKLPSPAPLAFTPSKVLSEKARCLNCDVEMTIDHQCGDLNSDSDWEDVESDENMYPTIDLDCEDWADKFTASIHQFHEANP